MRLSSLMTSFPMVVLATSFLFAAHFFSSLLRSLSIRSCVMGRFVQASQMPRSSLLRLNGSRVPSRLMTIREISSCRSKVVKRCSHFSHTLRRRIARLSFVVRESITAVSAHLQRGQCMWIVYSFYFVYASLFRVQEKSPSMVNF